MVGLSSGSCSSRSSLLTGARTVDHQASSLTRSSFGSTRFACGYAKDVEMKVCFDISWRLTVASRAEASDSISSNASIPYRFASAW